MTVRIRLLVIGALLLHALSSASSADFLIYKLGGTRRNRRNPGYGAGPGPGMMAAPDGAGGGSDSPAVEIILQGKIVVNPGGTMTFTHPVLKESVSFSAQQLRDGDVEKKIALSPSEEYRRVLGQAGKDPDAVMK